MAGQCNVSVSVRQVPARCQPGATGVVDVDSGGVKARTAMARRARGLSAAGALATGSVGQ
jgi:hypothetical protein